MYRQLAPSYASSLPLLLNQANDDDFSGRIMCCRLRFRRVRSCFPAAGEATTSLSRIPGVYVPFQGHLRWYLLQQVLVYHWSKHIRSPRVNQVEQEMCSHLEWKLNMEPSALKEVESVVQRDSKGPGPYLAHHTLPAPSSSPFAHLKPSTNNTPTANPSFGSSVPPSPPSTTSPVPPKKPSQRSTADTHCSTSMDTQLPPSPLESHSNISLPANSISLITPPNHDSDTTKIVSSTGSNTMWVSCNNVSPPYHHVHTCKSLPTLAYPIPQFPLDMKHTSPKKTSTHQQAVSAKLNTVYVLAHPNLTIRSLTSSITISLSSVQHHGPMANMSHPHIPTSAPAGCYHRYQPTLNLRPPGMKPSMPPPWAYMATTPSPPPMQVLETSVYKRTGPHIYRAMFRDYASQQ